MIKKIKVILYIFISIFFINITYSHPLDISSSYLNFRDNNLEISTFFHSFQIETLFWQNWIVIRNIEDYYSHPDIIKEYIKDNIILKNNSSYCEINNVEIIETDYYLILTEWLEVRYNFVCESTIKSWSIQIEYFNNFPLQTNRANFFDLNNIDNANRAFDFFVFNNNLNEYNFDLTQTNAPCLIDSDWDWLPDEIELLLWTDPYNIDTDWDWYTDYEEYINSWDPLDPIPWPWQEKREELPYELIIQAKNNIKTAQDCENEKLNYKELNKNIWILEEWYANKYFKTVLKTLAEFFSANNEKSIIIIFLMVMFLWFLHAAWPWHAKSLLVTYMIDWDKKYKDWLIFIFVFTITHIIDIVILFLVTKYLLINYNIWEYMLYIQKISVILLVILWFFLLYRAIKNIKLWNWNCNQNNLKTNIYIWFLTWLVPCTFWWSIFLLLFSIWKFYLILPMIVALWIWIFLFLFLVLNLTYFLRSLAYNRINKISKYSAIFSSSLLILIWIILFINIYFM